MKRIATIDFIRGFAIFGVCFVHFFSDLFDQGSALDNISNLPLSFVILLLTIVYIGTWGGLFVMISATGNMFSMHGNMEKGIHPKEVAFKQIGSGIALLIVSLLVEGVFQRYGYLGTLVPIWGPPEPSRAFWHMYAMTPVHCLAVCMIINGFVHGLLSQNGGFREYKRNILVYIVLGIIVIAVSQSIWDFAGTLILNYPNGHYPADLGLAYDHQVAKPLMGLVPWFYLRHFGILVIAGSNTPLFPFLFTSFIGNAIGIALIQEREKIVNEEKYTSHFCLKGAFLGLLVFLSGIVIGIIVGAGFNEFLPLSNSFADITGISEGQDWLWYPWFAFQTGGQIIFIFIMLRTIEFRGKTEKFAEKTTFIRRFGMPAFTIYAFHRFIGLVPVTIVAWIFNVDVTLGSKNLSFGYALIMVGLAILAVHGIMILWERIGYVGSLEWIMGAVLTMAFPKIPKSKSAVSGTDLSGKKDAKAKKMSVFGPINVKKAFYEVEWEEGFKHEDNVQRFYQEMRIALWLSVFGLLVLPLSFLSLSIIRKIQLEKYDDEYADKAKKIKIISYVLIGTAIILWIALSFLNLGILGISL